MDTPLAQYPIVVCDVGARGQAPSELMSLFPYMIYYGFDADEAECARLAAEPHPYASMRIFPRFVGGTCGVTPFNLYAERGRSSVYRVYEKHVAAFGDTEQFRLDETVEVVATTLDEIAASEHLLAPDVLKLDTQGSELDILRSATATLASAHLVETEASFTQIYDGRTLFHDVAKLFAEQGYELLYLSRHFSQRKGSIAVPREASSRRETRCSAVGRTGWRTLRTAASSNTPCSSSTTVTWTSPASSC